MSNTPQSITLADGRKLGYQTFGDPSGIPLFFFHGTPGSRFVLAQDDLIVNFPGVYTILPERPGYGISDPKPDRTLIDWPNDVNELADQLGIDSYAVSGASGGGPHALACAYCCPSRVTMALLLSSPSPGNFPGATKGMSFGNKIGLTLNKYAPWFIRLMMRSYASGFLKNPQRFMDQLAMQMAESDKVLLEDEEYRNAIIRDLKEAYRQGSEGHMVDGQLSMGGEGWGFDLSKISVPVFMWYGIEDTLVSINMARHLASTIPQCKSFYVENAGHLLEDHPDVVQQFQAALHGEAVEQTEESKPE